MFKVLIVDDEPMIRQGLMDFIDWELLGCQAEEAEDGVEAIRYLSYSSVDIIITDISMPEVSGIDIARFVRDKNKECKIIMITAYSEFEYAKSAVEYGVSDFLMKPVNKNELVSAVNKCIGSIQTESQKQTQIMELKQRVEETQGEIREKFIQDIVNLVLIHTDQLEKKAGELGLALDRYYVVIFEAAPMEENENQALASRNKKSIKNFLSTSFSAFVAYFASLSNHLICAIIPADQRNPADFMKEIVRLCRNMLSTARDLIPYWITVGISNVHEGVNEILSAYNESLFALNTRPADEPIGAYSAEMTTASGFKMQTADINHKINSISQNIHLCKKQEAMQMIRELLNNQYTSNNQLSFLRNLAMIIVSDCLKILYDFNTPGNLPWNPAADIYFSLNKAQTPRQMIQLLDSLLDDIMDTIGRISTDESYMVNLAKKYIEKNFGRNISLQIIADSIYVNPSYLSRIYKRDTGHTITEEVNRFRMERAKELLAGTMLKKKEIAAMVGIDDPIYFSRIFKKMVGISPSEYRQAYLSNNLC